MNTNPPPGAVHITASGHIAASHPRYTQVIDALAELKMAGWDVTTKAVTTKTEDPAL